MQGLRCCWSLNVKLCFGFFDLGSTSFWGRAIVYAQPPAFDNLDYERAHSVNKLVSKTETSVLAELITATGPALSS